MSRFLEGPARAAALALGLAIAAPDAAPAAAETVRLTEVADWRPVFGQVESVKRAAARTRIAGTLTMLTVSEGDAVATGQRIALVEDPKIALELAALDAAVRALEAQLAQARIDLDRAEQLRERGAVPTAALDQARTQLEFVTQTIAARKAERAALAARADEGAVLAPEAGRVIAAPMVQGMAVQPGEVVAEIAAEDFVLRARLPERHAAFLAVGDGVRITARGMLTGGESREGRIAKVYPALEAGRVVVDIAAEGLGDYFVGERVRLDVATGRRPAIVARAECLERRHGVTFARLGSGAEVVVQPGVPVDGGVEILAGLKPGDALQCGS
ncbi:efflux RND transporter periplasmic adaptor subunit [Rhodovulum sp. DZ06]|uniref:efflux RND transporter periplasmic adaptor subunit n=1 Tax=Rhodovulum sp. DZ06 TaxID=3425126 RepID=UPI003D34F97C